MTVLNLYPLALIDGDEECAVCGSFTDTADDSGRLLCIDCFICEEEI